MPNFKPSDTMPKLGHVTEVREQWLVRTDGALAHHLQDKEIFSHLCENRYRNQQIREDFPMALSEQRCIEYEAKQQQMRIQRQAEIDAHIARQVSHMNIHDRRNVPRYQMSESVEENPRSANSMENEIRRNPNHIDINKRRPQIPQEPEWRLPTNAVDDPLPRPPKPNPHPAGLSRTAEYGPGESSFHNSNAQPQAAVGRNIPKQSQTKNFIIEGIDIDALGLSHSEIIEMRYRLEQEEKDATLARELMAKDRNGESEDALLIADMRCAVEAQDSELARLLQDREYKRLQKAKEKARQKALLKKQQKLSQPQIENQDPYMQNNANLLDAYSNPRDMIHDSREVPRSSKSIESDLNYIEPFEKEHIQSKAEAINSKQKSQELFANISGYNLNNNQLEFGHSSRHSVDSVDSAPRNVVHNQSILYRQPPPPVPSHNKKPRFPDPVSIRPASYYSNENSQDTMSSQDTSRNSDNNNTLLSNYSGNLNYSGQNIPSNIQESNRLMSQSISSDNIQHSGKKKNKKNISEVSKKKKSCKIQ